MCCSSLLMPRIAGAAPNSEGAFTNALQPDETICFTGEDFDKLTSRTWLAQMKKRGKECRLTEPEVALPSLRRWKAQCTDHQGALHQYDFSITLPDQQSKRIIISSKVTNAAGKIELKRGFLGERQGDCQPAMQQFAMWEYFDLPESRGMESVARDLLYCGAIYSGIAPHIKEPKREKIVAIGVSLTAGAAGILPDNPEFLQQEMELAANRAAGEIAGASNEKLLQLLQIANWHPYLAPDGIFKAITQKKCHAALTAC
jgi:hypothetical protein